MKMATLIDVNAVHFSNQHNKLWYCNEFRLNSGEWAARVLHVPFSNKQVSLSLFGYEHLTWSNFFIFSARAPLLLLLSANLSCKHFTFTYFNIITGILNIMKLGHNPARREIIWSCPSCNVYGAPLLFGWCRPKNICRGGARLKFNRAEFLIQPHLSKTSS